jgi:hypothetical protein
MKFKTFRDNDYDNTFISKRLNNGDWDYWLLIRLQYLEEYLPEDEIKTTGKYSADIIAISIEAAQEHIEQAIECMGFQDGIEITEEIKIESLLDYGIYATLWSKTSNNKNLLLKQAREEIQKISFLFGFYMDKAENMIGNDGWDFISGNIGFKQQTQ